MPAQNQISLIFYGGDADEHRLDLYDASVSYEGLARTLAIIGHYYLTQKIIAKAPHSAMPLYLVPPTEGSIKQGVIAGIVGGLVVAGIEVPFTIFATRLIEGWVPAPSNPEMQRVIQLLEEQNDLLRISSGLPAAPTSQLMMQNDAAEDYIEEKSKELQIVRSVTSQSFKRIYRPIDTGSAEQAGIIGGLGHTPRAVVDKDVLGRIEADEVDAEATIVMAIVNSFSRSSKTGIVFSRDYMAGFRIEYVHKARLPTEDDFSWSQFRQKPIRMTGRFVRFFDGKIKKFLVSHVERVIRQVDIDDYFNGERPVLQL